MNNGDDQYPKTTKKSNLSYLRNEIISYQENNNEQEDIGTCEGKRSEFHPMPQILT